MNRISANYIFPVDRPPIRNGIIETDNDGTIRKIYDFGGEMRELAHTEFLNGVLVPGFINMHTHLELSWQNRLPQNPVGMSAFIEKMINDQPPENFYKTIEQADKFMYKNGVVAACDIANTEHTHNVKKKSKILYHTFVEISGLKKSVAKERLQQGLQIIETFKKDKLRASLAPHAPYSISQKLWKLIEIELIKNEYTSIHNQESIEELEMFESQRGTLLDFFQNNKMIDVSWKSPSSSPLKNALKYLNKTRLLLVHNTFTTQKDIDEIQKYGKRHFCLVLCPTSNYYISGHLPNLELLRKSGLPITLGTDSTASGKSLSILEEFKFLQKHTDMKFEDLLIWSTINAAKFMNWNHLGSITPGKKPGINLITSFNFNAMKLKEESKLKRII